MTTVSKRTSNVIGRRAHSTHHIVVRSHGCRVLFAILLLANLVALLPVASADTPDPTWLAGIYDEADGDSVVWLIESTEMRIHPGSASEGKPDSDVSRPVRATEALCCPSDAPPATISLVASPFSCPVRTGPDVTCRLR